MVYIKTKFNFWFRFLICNLNFDISKNYYLSYITILKIYIKDFSIKNLYIKKFKIKNSKINLKLLYIKMNKFFNNFFKKQSFQINKYKKSDFG